MTEPEISSDLDAAPVDALDDLFQLPTEMRENEMFTRWYAEIRERLRRESRGIPMKTAQLMLQERIARGYLMQRVREEMGAATDRTALDAEKLWLQQIQEFNRTLEKNNEKILNEILVQVSTILQDVLPKIKDKDERAAIREEMITRLDEIEL